MATYVHGNVVRKEDVQPKEARQHAQRRQEKVRHMSSGYVLFLAVAIIVALFACVQYLQLQSEIASRSKHITSLQKELADAKEENTTRYNAVMNSMNLEEIREIAIYDFGMVYAQPDQIIRYQSPIGNIVEKFIEIPESGIIASSETVK